MLVNALTNIQQHICFSIYRFFLALVIETTVHCLFLLAQVQ